MTPVYTAGIKLYGLAARLAGLRSAKARDFAHGRAKAISALERLTSERAPNGYDYWFHVASLGEFEQARPLIERIKRQTPDATILLSFFSPSGYNVRKDYDLASAVVYLPEDTARNAKRFLDIARPKRSVFVKYEFWLNMLHELAIRNIPTYLISAIFRPGQIFFRPWGGVFRRGLRTFRTIYVQDNKSRELLGGIGMGNVRITGDTRLDRVHDIMTGQTGFPGIEKWTEGHFTLIVGSSWPRDEDRYLEWVNMHPEVKVIIAPHEFDEQRLKTLRNRLTGKSVLWTEIFNQSAGFSDIEATNAPSEDVQVLIVNTFGKLAALYRYADAVIVGGGLGAGIHNINEAAVYGVPVMFGPNNHKFKEAADLKNLGGGFEYTTSADISTLLNRMLTDKAFVESSSKIAGDYIKANLGATDIIHKEITSES